MVIIAFIVHKHPGIIGKTYDGAGSVGGGCNRWLKSVPGVRPLVFFVAFCCICTASQYLAFSVILDDFRTFYSYSQSSGKQKGKPFGQLLLNLCETITFKINL